VIEVVLRLLHGLEAISQLNPKLRQAALEMARDARGRAASALKAPSDLEALDAAATFDGTDQAH
jgi:hypothetical protein